jgi:hypothetical protein
MSDGRRGKKRMKLTLLAALVLLTGACRLAAPPLPAPLQLGDTVISDAVIWSGEVRIRGTVTVKKTGTLTIRPGSRILFERIDHDGDGIGDAEIYVEGSLLAQGTATEPILFSSAAAQPQPGDWKFLYLDYARKAELRHVIAEYAYSGVQIHFCKATVLDSEFRYNVDGVRFSTVNIEVARNRIHHNRHGIRYEERRGAGSVYQNEIVDNEIGIFVVTRSDNRTLFRNNNIVSRQYNVKLGFDQAGDVTFPLNWWGTNEAAAIRAAIYDHAADATLGRVQTPDPLPAPLDLMPPFLP